MNTGILAAAQQLERNLINPEVIVPININTVSNIIANGIEDTKLVIAQSHLIPAGAVTLTIRSGTTPIYGPVALAANVPLSIPPGLLRTKAGEDLVIILSAAVQVGGALGYNKVRVAPTYESMYPRR